MVLLIGYDYELDQSNVFGTFPGEIEIRLWDFQEANANTRGMTEALISASQVHETAAIHIFDNANTLCNLMLIVTPNNRNQDSHRQLCNAAQALKDLDSRKNSVLRSTSYSCKFMELRK